MELLFFGIAKDIVGKSSIDLSKNSSLPKSVEDVKLFLTKKYPDFSKLSSLAIAVNSEYAADDVVLNDGDEIAIIPPVSGG
ncbi:molybdopterin synthase sulfur carrier subunit [Kriegella sp. EG-1]|nr:molybdopterin synthase sulfur carrier subunit [Flavobacteriaceae bacterium EG-1]